MVTGVKCIAQMFNDCDSSVMARGLALKDANAWLSVDFDAEPNAQGQPFDASMLTHVLVSCKAADGNIDFNAILQCHNPQGAAGLQFLVQGMAQNQVFIVPPQVVKIGIKHDAVTVHLTINEGTLKEIGEHGKARRDEIEKMIKEMTPDAVITWPEDKQ